MAVDKDGVDDEGDEVEDSVLGGFCLLASRQAPW